MSDFLDRLAARAIGSETTLAPRLPSLCYIGNHFLISRSHASDEREATNST